MVEAAQYFYQAVTEVLANLKQTNFNGLYYIAEMLQEYPELN